MPQGSAPALHLLRLFGPMIDNRSTYNTNQDATSKPYMQWSAFATPELARQCNGSQIYLHPINFLRCYQTATPKYRLCGEIAAVPLNLFTRRWGNGLRKLEPSHNVRAAIVQHDGSPAVLQDIGPCVSSL
jgi:hypothetical protein